MYNQDLLDAVSLLSFIVGVANYNENLTQNDKDDIMRRLACSRIKGSRIPGFVKWQMGKL